MAYPEPPDGLIVGWGHPVSEVRVRIDEYADDDRHWFGTGDATGEAPMAWDPLCALHVSLDAPYLLVRQDLTPGPD